MAGVRGSGCMGCQIGAVGLVPAVKGKGQLASRCMLSVTEKYYSFVPSSLGSR